MEGPPENHGGLRVAHGPTDVAMQLAPLVFVVGLGMSKVDEAGRAPKRLRYVLFTRDGKRLELVARGQAGLVQQSLPK